PLPPHSFPTRRSSDLYPKDIIKDYHLTALWRSFVKAGYKMAERFPDECKRELNAMARGAGIDPKALIVGNTLFDLKKIIACSALDRKSTRLNSSHLVI